MRNALSYLIRCLGLYLVSAPLACGLNFPNDWFGQPLLSQPLRMEDLDGAMIAKVAREKNSLPLLYPRVVSVFEWMDRGDPEMITLKDLRPWFLNIVFLFCIMGILKKSLFFWQSV